MNRSILKNKKASIAVLFEEAGASKAGIGAGPRIGLKYMIEAVREYSEHAVDFYCYNDISDQGISENVKRLDLSVENRANLIALLRNYEVVQVANGAKLAAFIENLCGRIVLGPNVIFNFPFYRSPGDYPVPLGENTDRFDEEEDLCSRPWEAVLMPNEGLRPLYSNRLGITSTTGLYGWPFGISVAQSVAPSSRRTGIVWAGSPLPAKGGAFARSVAEKIPDAGWTFLGIDEPFTYGQQREALEGAKIVLITSRFETQGLLALEAIASGAVVVVTKHQNVWNGREISVAPPYIYHGENAIVVEPSVDAVVDVINSLLSQPDIMDDFSKSAMSWVQKNLSYKSSAHQYDAIIRRILFERSSKSGLPDLARAMYGAANFADALFLTSAWVDSEPFSLDARALAAEVVKKTGANKDTLSAHADWLDRLARGFLRQAGDEIDRRLNTTDKAKVVESISATTEPTYEFVSDVMPEYARQIKELYRQHGNEVYFIEIGAMDGKRFDHLWSATQDYDWSGIVVEPLPDMFAKLTANYSAKKKISCVNAAITELSGPMVMYRVTEESVKAHNLPEWAIGISSLYQDRNALGGKGCSAEDFARISPHIEKTSVQTLTLRDMLAQHGVKKLIFCKSMPKVQIGKC